MSRRSKIMRSALGWAFLLPLSTFGQYQQFPQNDARVNLVSPYVDPRVNQELYGNTGGSVRYPFQQALLPSEYRYLILQSGATPAEVRLQRERVGPLAPDPYSYIPGFVTPPRFPSLPAPLPVSPGAQQPAPNQQPGATVGPGWGGESINWGGPVTVLPQTGDYTLQMSTSPRYSPGMTDPFGVGNPNGVPTYVAPKTTAPSTQPK